MNLDTWRKLEISLTLKKLTQAWSRFFDVSVTPLFGTDPVGGWGDPFGDAPVFVDSLVSLQGPDSRGRVYSAMRVSGLC